MAQSRHPVWSRSSDHLIAVSGSGSSGTGSLLLIDDIAGDANVEVIDHLTSHVLCVGDLFFRIVPCDLNEAAGSELLVYDRTGIGLYRRIPGLADPHAFAHDGTHLVVSNTHSNQILWLTEDGETARVWQAPTEAADSWHVNGVHVHDGRVVASAFGRFPNPSTFAASTFIDAGIVFDPETGANVVNGLSCPHDPRFIDGGWFVCDSKHGCVVHVDDAGNRGRRADLGRWTRGVAVDADRIFVGLSAQRYDENDCAGAVAILDRTTWTVERIVPLPLKEVNSVEIVPRSFVGALRRGFRTNSYRVHMQDRDELFRIAGSIHPLGETTPMTRLEPEACRVSITASAPASAKPGETFAVRLLVVNSGNRTFLSCPPFPVHVGFRVARSDGTAVGELEQRRAILPEPLAGGNSITMTVHINAPEEPGRYTLSFTLVQESVCWFDSLVGENGTTVAIEIMRSRTNTSYGSHPERRRQEDGVRQSSSIAG